MLETWYCWRGKIISFFYKSFLKKIFFQFDPEKIHDRMLFAGKLIGSKKAGLFIVSIFFNYKNDCLSQKILGMKLVNPVGLAAGFDKEAEITDVCGSMGFGSVEVGSITGQPCQGNQKPRLWRLKKSQSIVVNYGLKNSGCQEISKRLKNRSFNTIIGISIAQTNDIKISGLDMGIKDYLSSYKAFKDIGDYYTINISCPNSVNSCSFLSMSNLEKLLQEIALVKKSKPIFLKISPDLEIDKIDKIIELAKLYKIDGFVCSNLTKKRNNKKIIENEIPEKGGLSGKVVRDLSNSLIEYVYKKTKGDFIIVGVGGIFSAEDAYKKIKLGASFVQLITGMIFEGPQLIGVINQGLVKLLKRDGYNNISEAIGADIKN